MARFLLLHGACHGGWCWESVAPILQSAGHQTTASDLPCSDLTAGLSASADAAVASLQGEVGDVVVVAHSLGALVAPLVADRLPVRRMVMLAGIVGAPRASLEMLAAEDADRDGPLGDGDPQTDSEGRFRFSPEGARRILYQDCPPEVADAAIARLRFERSMWTEVAQFEAWPEVETVSITCTEDRVVNPGWSNRIARERLGVEPIELPGGHSPFLARPAALAEVLLARPVVTDVTYRQGAGPVPAAIRKRVLGRDGRASYWKDAARCNSSVVAGIPRFTMAGWFGPSSVPTRGESRMPQRFQSATLVSDCYGGVGWLRFGTR